MVAPQTTQATFFGFSAPAALSPDPVWSPSRMVDGRPHIASPEDYYVHGTIHFLYRRCTRRVLMNCSDDPVPYDPMLDGLWKRLIYRHCLYEHQVELEGMSFSQLSLFIDFGGFLLEREFPIGSDPGALENVTLMDYSHKDDRLQGLCDNLKHNLYKCQEAANR